MIWLGFAGWLLLMVCWFAHVQYRRRCQIARCDHRRGEVVSVDDRSGSAEYLVWICADCPFQASLGELRAMPGRDRFWYTRGAAVWEGERGAEAAALPPLAVDRDRDVR